VHVALCAEPSVPAVLRDGRTYEVNQRAHVVVQPGRSVTLASASLNPVRLTIATPGQQRAMQLAGAKSAGPGTISGIVRSPSGRPLAGICVTVWAFSANGGAGIGLSTGPNGKYSIEPAMASLPQHGLRVQFTAGAVDCGNKGNYAPQWWKNVATEAKATSLTVKPGTHLKNIDAKMTTGGQFSGVVRASTKTGHPLRGICIETLPTSDSEFLFLLPNAAFTAANGTYTVDDLGTGSYVVVAAPGAECGGKAYGNDDYLVASYPHVVKVVAGKHVNGIDFLLRLGGILAGTVTSDGVGTAGVCVDFDENGVPTGQFTTGAGGSFQIQQLTPGRYQLAYTGGCGNTGSLAPQFYPGAVNAEDATTLTLTYGQTRSGLDAAMQPGATISGLVTNTLGAPLGQICIEPTSPQELGPLPNALSLFASLSAGAVSGSKGGYFLRNLAPGSYYLLSATCNNANIATEVYAAPGQSQPTLVSAPVDVDTSSVNIVEPKGGTISGIVRNAQGHPLAGMCIEAVPSASTASALTSAEGQTGKNGKYGINGLATGSYKVEFSACGLGRYADSWYGGASFFASAKTVIVKAGYATSGINGVLRTGQLVSGRVTNGTTGAALKNLCVFAYDPQGNPIGAGITNGDGDYVVTELAPGTYTLQFGSCSVDAVVAEFVSGSAPAGSASPAASAPAGLAPASRTVTVTSSRPATGINEALKPGGHITGVVQAGTPAAAQPGVCVEATPVTGNGVASVAVTESGGNYRLGPLAAGTYQLEFTTACSTGTEALVTQQYPTVVTVKPPQTDSAVDATLVSDGGITGTVTNQSSADVAGVCVTAQAAGGTPVEAVTGSSGSYTIPALTPGSYTVEFSSGCGAKGYATQWWDNETSAAGATPVPVTAGATASGIDATLSS
jgi:Carboxypeptidase regulatory-like domain